MAKRTRRIFTESFKTEAIRLANGGDGNLAAAARDLDVHVTTLRDWVRREQKPQGDAEALSPSERQELVQLRKDCAVLKMEREILKNPPRGASYLLNEKLLAWYRGHSQEGAAVCFLGTKAIPLKNMVQGLQRTWQWRRPRAIPFRKLF